MDLRLYFMPQSFCDAPGVPKVMKCLIGKKLAMTQVFKDDGTVIPVTVVSASPCVVTQVKQKQKDGADAIQVGMGHAASKKHSKPMKGHLKDLPSVTILRDFRVEQSDSFSRGDTWTAGVFVAGEKVTVVGTSKGHGFQGVVKRHGFSGSPASHGHKDQLRMPGSIGSKRQGPVQKGKRMAGRMGNDRVTLKNIEVVAVDETAQSVMLKGAIPGARGSIVEVYAEGKMNTTSYIALPQENPITVQHAQDTDGAHHKDQSPA